MDSRQLVIVVLVAALVIWIGKVVTNTTSSLAATGKWDVRVGNQTLVVRVGHELERQVGQEQPVAEVPPTAYAPQTDEEMWSYDRE